MTLSAGTHRLRKSKMRFAALLGTLALSASLFTGQVSTTGAVFTDGSSAGGNTLSTTVLQSPTNVTAAPNGTKIDLSWTPSASTATQGYYVFRSSDGSTQGALVATVTPRSAASWTDTSPLQGPNYYTVRAYAHNWQSGTVTSPPVTPPPVSITDTFLGSGAMGNSEVGDKPWQAFNGTWSRNGSGFATTGSSAGANPMLVADLTSANVDITAELTDRSGEAIYFRASDANNWLRARFKMQQNSEPYTYYVTEYEHVTSYTEYQYQPYITQNQYQTYAYEHLWQPYVTETLWNSYSHEDQWDSGTWGAWFYHSTSACQTSVDQVNLPANTATEQYQIESGSRHRSDCAAGKYRWNKQIRRWGAGGTIYWSSTGPRTSTAIWTGNSREVPNGWQYWAVNKAYFADTSAGQTRNVASGSQYWAVNARQSIDQWTGQARPYATGSYYYATAKNQDIDQPTGATRNVASGATYWATTPRNSIDQVVSSRVVNNSTWDTNYCAGCNTRQSQRTGYNTVNNYTVVLDKSVNGTVTQINSWAVPNANELRVVASGNSITIYRNATTLVGSVTETTHNSATLHGCGLAGDTTSPTNRLTYVTMKAV